MDNQKFDTNTDALLEQLLEAEHLGHEQKLIKHLLQTSIGLAEDKTEKLNLKIASAALKEMREAYQLFAPYQGVPKVTIFGSARTADHDPLWQLAHDTAKQLADEGWMVLTGAGPGIMQAAAVGAGPEQSLGVSIRLPFEEMPSSESTYADRRVAMKYFFTRKLMLVKESLGFVSLPGGFGTMDEVFELLTLQQTGKMVPVPIVLLDRPGGSYWRGFKDLVDSELSANGYTAETDLDRVLITDSVEEAVEEINRFWSNYISLRWFGDLLVMRVRKAPDKQQLNELNEKFSTLVAKGKIELTEPLSAEVRDNDELDAERIAFRPVPRQVGELHRLIRALNSL